MYKKKKHCTIIYIARNSRRRAYFAILFVRTPFFGKEKTKKTKCFSYIFIMHNMYSGCFCLCHCLCICVRLCTFYSIYIEQVVSYFFMSMDSNNVKHHVLVRTAYLFAYIYTNERVHHIAYRPRFISFFFF